MTCREVVEFLLGYFEGEIAADERARFDEHLAVCPACVSYLRTYGDAVRLGKLAARAEEAAAAGVPEELVQAILAARGRGAEPA